MPTTYKGKYRNYKNKKWLEEKYHLLNLSMREICTLENIDRSTLIYWFRKLDVPARPASKRMTELYFNKEWLYQKYFVEKLSAQKIADLCGCSFIPVYYWLDKYGFERRYKGESKRVHSKDTQSVYKQLWGRKEYINWRYTMFARDDFTCGECNVRGGNLELHHIIPCRDYEEGIMREDNVITLCKKCHALTFGKEYTFSDKYQKLIKVVQ